MFAMEAFASAAVVERARTGSLRLLVVSLEFRMAEMEAAKAVGSLRLDFAFLVALVKFGFEGSVAEEWSESVSEVDGDDLASD